LKHCRANQGGDSKTRPLNTLGKCGVSDQKKLVREFDENLSSKNLVARGHLASGLLNRPA
jgi:hypothetical protein